LRSRISVGAQGIGKIAETLRNVRSTDNTSAPLRQGVSQFPQSNGLKVFADRIALKPRMNHEAPGGFQVVAGFVEPPGGLGGATALDFDRPTLAAGQFQQQVNLGAAGGSVEARHGERGRGVDQVFDHKAFPARAHHRVPEQGVAIGDTVATSIRETTGRRLHRFSWINEWKELADARGTPLGIELILPDWFYAGVFDAALVLTIDPAYFKLTGGIERWLYRLVRKHGGEQPGGWQFDFKHLHRKSGSTAKRYDFACDLRALVARQSMSGYVLGIERMPDDRAELLTFRPVPPTARG